LDHRKLGLPDWTSGKKILIHDIQIDSVFETESVSHLGRLFIAMRLIPSDTEHHALS